MQGLKVVGHTIEGVCLCLLSPFLACHGYYRMKIAKPSPFPTELRDAMMETKTRQDLKETRQELLEDVKDIIGGRDNSQALERLAEHPEFEDPFQCWKGRNEMLKLVSFCQRNFENVDYEIRNELHSESEILMDWTLHITLQGGGWSLSVPMKTQIVLAKDDSSSREEERVVKIQENWHGRQLVTPHNTVIPGLGWMHVRLRRGIGWMGAKFVKL